MTQWFGSHYAELSSPTLAPATSLFPVQSFASPGFDATRHRFHSRLDFTSATLLDADEWRLFTLSSSDRIVDFWVSSDVLWSSTGGSSSIDVGCFEAGSDHDGIELQKDLLSDGLNIVTFRNRFDAFKQADLSHQDRGLPLWQLIDIGGITTYTSDPHIQIDIVVTYNLTPTVTESEVLFEIEFLRGGQN